MEVVAINTSGSMDTAGWCHLLMNDTTYRKFEIPVTCDQDNLIVESMGLKIPVLALSQLSRAVETQTVPIPKLAHLRESGSIEQDADVVVFIYREEYYKQDTERKNIADVIIAKHRNGPTGRLELFFDIEKASFKNLEKIFSE